MEMITGERIRSTLGQLSRQQLKAFKMNLLAHSSENAAFDQSLTKHAQAEVLMQLENNALGFVRAAANHVIEISSQSDAHVYVHEAVAQHFAELKQALDNWAQRYTAFSISGFDAATLELLRSRVEKAVDRHAVRFDRSLNTTPSAQAKKLKAGRPQEYDWMSAANYIWGRIYRGELIPRTQSEIELALQGYLAQGEKEPSTSTVRPIAKKIWQEFKREDEN